MNARPKDVDAYITAAPKELQAKLRQMRAAIKSAAPKAEEKISYGMPYYSYRGRLAYFAYFKDHISLFAVPPLIEEHKEELNRYKTSKGTIQFPLDDALPTTLIRKLVKARVAKNEAEQK
jgi:uncharacterized protein YdhG (YjbR/CyaY superfamily)